MAEQAFGGGPTLVLVDQGAELNDGSPAAAARIMIPHGDEALDGANKEGLSTFDAAVRYALRPDRQPQLFAGDADMNLDFPVAV